VVLVDYCNSKKFFASLEYLDALNKWVEEHPGASFNKYVRARNQLRRTHGVEFLEKWREDETL